uniref:Uncharacterized protein n=1 Tax=Caenorhabditis japonica TaxID=281687 RepID=A0A8R1EAQ3_CAEJA
MVRTIEKFCRRRSLRTDDWWSSMLEEAWIGMWIILNVEESEERECLLVFPSLPVYILAAPFEDHTPSETPYFLSSFFS